MDSNPPLEVNPVMADGENRQAAEGFYYHAVDELADGNLPAAIEQFLAAIALDKNFTDAWHGLVRALQDAGELDQAVEFSLRLAAMEPDDVLVHTRLSILYQMQGRIPEAEAEAAKARVLGWKRELQNKKNSVAGNLL